MERCVIVALLWPAWNHNATSFLRNTILVCSRTKTDNNAYLIIWVVSMIFNPECARNRVGQALPGSTGGSSERFHRPPGWIWKGNPPGQKIDTKEKDKRKGRERGRREREGRGKRDKKPHWHLFFPLPALGNWTCWQVSCDVCDCCVSRCRSACLSTSISDSSASAARPRRATRRPVLCRRPTLDLFAKYHKHTVAFYQLFCHTITVCFSFLFLLSFLEILELSLSARPITFCRTVYHTLYLHFATQHHVSYYIIGNYGNYVINANTHHN